MRCPDCDGKGYITGRDWNIYLCKKCEGEGSIPPYEPFTNEDWFCSLTTEEKAKWLSQHSQHMYNCGEKHATPKTMYEEDWEFWLKAKHEV